MRELRLVGRIGNYLSPEETVQVLARRAGNHAIRNVEIGKAVVVEIKCVTRPWPAGHSNPGGSRCVPKRIATLPGLGIPQQRIARCMLAIEGPNFFRRISLENLLRGNALAGRGPHVSDVKILSAVVVIIEPANAHPRANILDSRLRGKILKRPTAFVTFKLL